MKSKLLYYITIILIIFGFFTLISYLNKLERRYYHSEDSVLLINLSDCYTREYSDNGDIIFFAEKEASKKIYKGQKVKIILNLSKDNKKEKNMTINGNVIFKSHVSEPTPSYKDYPKDKMYFARKVIIKTDFILYKLPKIIILDKVVTEPVLKVNSKSKNKSKSKSKSSKKR